METTHYFHHYIIAKYTYKGIGIEKETRRMLNEHDDFSRLIDGYEPSEPGETVSVVNAGNGQFPLLFALVHPETEEEEVEPVLEAPVDLALPVLRAPHLRAEPAVQVLTRQVEEISNGYITQRSIQTAHVSSTSPPCSPPSRAAGQSPRPLPSARQTAPSG